MLKLPLVNGVSSFFSSGDRNRRDTLGTTVLYIQHIAVTSFLYVVLDWFGFRTYVLTHFTIFLIIAIRLPPKRRGRMVSLRLLSTVNVPSYTKK